MSLLSAASTTSVDSRSQDYKIHSSRGYPCKKQWKPESYLSPLQHRSSDMDPINPHTRTQYRLRLERALLNEGDTFL